MCFCLVHLAETLVLTIDNMLLVLLQSSSFVPSWHRAVQLSYNPAQTRGRNLGLSGSLYFHASDLCNLSIIVSYSITSLMLFVHSHIIW
jgi:hypothetical protein